MLALPATSRRPRAPDRMPPARMPGATVIGVPGGLRLHAARGLRSVACPGYGYRVRPLPPSARCSRGWCVQILFQRGVPPTFGHFTARRTAYHPPGVVKCLGALDSATWDDRRGRTAGSPAEARRPALKGARRPVRRLRSGWHRLCKSVVFDRSRVWIRNREGRTKACQRTRAARNPDRHRIWASRGSPRTRASR